MYCSLQGQLFPDGTELRLCQAATEASMRDLANTGRTKYVYVVGGEEALNDEAIADAGAHAVSTYAIQFIDDDSERVDAAVDRCIEDPGRCLPGEESEVESEFASIDGVNIYEFVPVETRLEPVVPNG